MNDILIMVSILAAWVVLQKFILPRLGIQT